MAIQKPTLQNVREVANRLGFSMADGELEEYFALMQDGLAAYELIEAMPEKSPAQRYPRQAGYRPSPDENRYGAWYRKATVKGAAKGKLARKKIVLKDNVSLAGVPMAAGTSILEGYAPAWTLPS
jgi:amidase